jgi:hypothetical protein
MLSFLKPNKANVGGTALLLAANWAAGFVPRLVLPLLGAAGGGAGSGAASQAGRAAFAGAASGGVRAGAGGYGFGLQGLEMGAISLAATALLFYIVLSFVMAYLARDGEDAKAKAGSGNK